MPRLLKNDSIRLIEASIEALSLAQIGICTFRKDELKIDSVRYSVEVGLIGVSIELAMNSVLAQAFGRKIIYKDESRYKTASEILHDFRSLLNQSSAITIFLTNGIKDGARHIEKILELTNRFQIMIISRANALHNGIGLSYEITASFFQEVSLFLNLLSLSSNYKPYLFKIPSLVGISIDKKVLIEDLYNKINNTSNPFDKKSLITSLFLILPELPKKMPEWIKCFERFNIAPKKSDTVYLVNALETANPVTLKKVRTKGEMLTVRIDNNDPSALPIAPQYLRTEFTQYKDQFYADISTANGRLGSNQLDLPPKNSVYNAFSIDLIEAGILTEGNLFNAHETWPFIVSALNTPKGGTCAPFWFMIRKTNDLGQLKSQLKRAGRIGNTSLSRNIDIILKGIDKVERNSSVDISDPFYSTILKEKSSFEVHLEKYETKISKSKNYPLPQTYEERIDDLFKEKIHVGEFLNYLINDHGLGLDTRKYWVFNLTQVFPEREDLIVLNEILNNVEYSSSYTNIRKSFRAIDFFLHGPKINTSA
ncbi:hypothetical protein QWZ08_15510 [Ferruginibacter paludis]|uniref:hypothetical protein n=1 Tax=Ferruginibacter paludis TaxID=1310417 RepID=UPI0025B56625|nr:hypothetical protein [Ferruginibacter paludis]MDN3657056.1 hypothetical protein [Ferruginibacter paludis]